MSAQKLDYSRVFNRLCHLVAITKQGKVEACIDNILLILYVIDNSFAPTSIEQISSAIYDYYGLPLRTAEIQSSLDRQQSRNAIYRDPSTRAYLVFPEVKAVLETKISEASQLEEQVREQWISSMKPVLKDAPREVEAKLWICLQTYMGKSFQRHGVQTIQLLKDSTATDFDETKTLASYLADALSSSGLTRLINQDLAIECIKNFFRFSTPERTRYIAQLLDGTFSFFALANDAVTTEYLKRTISPVSLFLDTNFIFGILDLHTNPLVEISKELIGAIKANNLPFKIYFHEETLTEITRTIGSIGNHLKSQRWQQSISRAAVKSVPMSGLERKYHQLNSETPTDAAVFLSKYDGIAELLKAQGFTIYRDPSSSRSEDTVEKSKLIMQYQEFIDRRRPKGPKPYEALSHDITVWWAANSIRRKGISVLDAGSLILTVDYFFYTFDWEHLRTSDNLGIVVLPNQILQLLRPFIPSTEDFDRRFVETFSLPEFRIVVSDYAATRSKVLSYINTYSDISEETATRILADSMLVDQLHGIDETSEEFRQAVDNAIIRDNELLLEEKEAAQSKVQELENFARAQEEELKRKELDNQQIVAIASEAQRKTEEAEKARLLAQQAIEQLENKVKQLQADDEREQKDTIGLQKKIREYERGNKQLRVLLALFIGTVGILIIAFMPRLFAWNWLNGHPNRLGLYGCAIIALFGLAWSIADQKHRVISLGAVVRIPDHGGRRFRSQVGH